LGRSPSSPCSATAAGQRAASRSRGHTRGAEVRELAGDAASPSLVIVNNPLNVPVLLYAGEELLGAGQNRILDVSALVGAGHRWRCRRAAWRPAGGRSAAATSRWNPHRRPRTRCCDEQRREQIDELARPIRLRPEPVGALVALRGNFVVLDHVSDANAWAALHARLVRGYALDALAASAAPVPSLEAARRFLGRVLAAPRHVAPAFGLGTRTSFVAGGLAGSALTHEDEFVALTAFAFEPAASQERPVDGPFGWRPR
jgi:hypothetical protein